MSAVVVLSIPRELFSHDGGNAMLAAFEEEMDVVIHEDPGIDGAFSLYDILSQSFEKSYLVLVVIEYIGLVDPPHHDMVQSSGNI
jgi:hypothetical protein